MKCPYCLSDRLGLSSNFTYEECGYDGDGIVEFYECDFCGTTVEVCIPDKNPYGDVNKKRSSNVEGENGRTVCVHEAEAEGTV